MAGLWRGCGEVLSYCTYGAGIVWAGRGHGSVGGFPWISLRSGSSVSLSNQHSQAKRATLAASHEHRHPLIAQYQQPWTPKWNACICGQVTVTTTATVTITVTVTCHLSRHEDEQRDESSWSGSLHGA